MPTPSRLPQKLQIISFTSNTLCPRETTLWANSLVTLAHNEQISTPNTYLLACSLRKVTMSSANIFTNSHDSHMNTTKWATLSLVDVIAWNTLLVVMPKIRAYQRAYHEHIDIRSSQLYHCLLLWSLGSFYVYFFLCSSWCEKKYVASLFASLNEYIKPGSLYVTYEIYTTNQ